MERRISVRKPFAKSVDLFENRAFSAISRDSGLSQFRGMPLNGLYFVAVEENSSMRIGIGVSPRRPCFIDKIFGRRFSGFLEIVSLRQSDLSNKQGEVEEILFAGHIFRRRREEFS